MRLTIAALAICIAGCASTPDATEKPGEARVGNGVVFVLPHPPEYASRRDLHQIVVAKIGNQEMTFEAFLRLAPDAVDVVITAPGGPRLARIEWTSDGIRSDRGAQTPAGLRSENFLADIMMVLWPPQNVEAALQPHGEVTDNDDGSRLIKVGGKVLVDIAPQSTGDGPKRLVLHNHDFDYTLSIITLPGE